MIKIPRLDKWEAINSVMQDSRMCVCVCGCLCVCVCACVCVCKAVHVHSIVLRFLYLASTSANLPETPGPTQPGLASIDPEMFYTRKYPKV